MTYQSYNTFTVSEAPPNAGSIAFMVHITYMLSHGLLQSLTDIRSKITSKTISLARTVFLAIHGRFVI